MRPGRLRLTARLLALIGGLALGAPALAAGVYRWVDKDGVVHYDDRQRGTSTPVTREYMEQRRVQAPPQAYVPAEILADVQLRCSSGRDRLQTYGGAQRVYGRDREGNVYQLSSDQVRQELVKAQAQVARFCGRGASERLISDQAAEAQAEERRQVRALEAVQQRARNQVQQR